MKLSNYITGYLHHAFGKPIFDLSVILPIHGLTDLPFNRQRTQNSEIQYFLRKFEEDLQECSNLVLVPASMSHMTLLNPIYLEEEQQQLILTPDEGKFLQSYLLRKLSAPSIQDQLNKNFFPITLVFEEIIERPKDIKLCLDQTSAKRLNGLQHYLVDLLCKDSTYPWILEMPLLSLTLARLRNGFSTQDQKQLVPHVKAFSKRLPLSLTIHQWQDCLLVEYHRLFCPFANIYRFNTETFNDSITQKERPL